MTIARIILPLVISATLGSADVYINDWQWWVILGCYLVFWLL